MDETDRREKEPELMEPLMTKEEETPKNGHQPPICTGSRDHPAAEAQKNPEMDGDIESTKYSCGSSCCFALWHVKTCVVEGGKEKMLDLNVTVESLRFATNGAFFIIIMLGIFATRAFDELPPDGTEIQKTYGNQNICLYFDYPPVPYFAPFLYNIVVLLVTCYSAASIIRIWIAYGEGKIKKWQRKLFNFCFGFLVFSAMLFSQCFAVQPKKDEVPAKNGILIQNITLGHETMLVHTIPFMILELALALAQVAVVCFGEMVSWKRTETEEHIPKCFITISIVHVILMCVITAIKLVFQVNALGKYQEGLWWKVGSDLNFILSTILDWTWFAFSFVFPLVQSIYLTCKDCKKFQTQILNITIRDNRKAD